MKRMNPVRASFLVSLFIFLQQCHAQETTARFLLLQPSARSMAMGGVGTSLADDPFAGYYNPAALVFGPSLGMTGSFVKPVPFFGNTVHSYLSAMYVINSTNAIGISTNLYHRSRQVVQTYFFGGSVTELEKNSPTSWQGKISYAHLVTENVSLGVSASMLRLNLVDMTELIGSAGKNPTGWIFDIGVLARNLIPGTTYKDIPETGEGSFIGSIGSRRAGDGLSVGFTVANVGTNVGQIDPAQSDAIPSLIRLGTSYAPVSTQPVGVLVAVEFEKRTHESSALDYIHVGGELTLLRLLSFRAGYFDDTRGPTNSYGTFGFGLDVKFFHCDIARYNSTLEPTWHFDSTLSMEF